MTTPPLRFYLAASYTRRAEMQDYAAQLTDRGQIVACSWLDDDAYPAEQIAMIEAPITTPEAIAVAVAHANNDLRDIVESEMVVLFTEGPDGPARGGRHVEYGAVLGLAINPQLNKAIARVGPVENIFHALTPPLLTFETFADLLDAFDRAGRCGYVHTDNGVWRCGLHEWHAQVHMAAEAIEQRDHPLQPNREQRRAMGQNGQGTPSGLIIPNVVPPQDLR